MTLHQVHITVNKYKDNQGTKNKISLHRVLRVYFVFLVLPKPAHEEHKGYRKNTKVTGRTQRLQEEHKGGLPVILLCF